MLITLEITKIQVLTGSGPDAVLLNTTLPEGCWPYTGHATLTVQVAAGTGEDYARKHFSGLDVEVTPC